MRDIKFRVWNKKERKFFKHFDNCRVDLALTYCELTPHVCYPEQWTNCNSFDDKEIYENDFVCVEFDETGSEIPRDFSGIVKFIESGFFVINNDLQLSFPVFQEITSWKITGNIYQPGGNE